VVDGIQMLPWVTVDCNVLCVAEGRKWY